MRFVAFFAVLAFAALAHPRAAFARPDFVDTLQQAAKAPCLPQCNICHESVNGGGRADQPFAVSLTSVGGRLRGADEMQYAVDQLKQQGVDSDGDGVGDIDEIHQGKDPNYAGDALICLPNVGCGAHVARRVPNDGLDACFALLVALGLAAIRRRH